MKKTIDDWKVEIQKIRSEKIEAGAAKFQEDRDQALDVLLDISGRLDSLETKIQELTAERSKLNPLISAEMARVNEIDRILFRSQKEIKVLRPQTDIRFQQLTAISEIDVYLALKTLGEPDGKGRKSK